MSLHPESPPYLTRSHSPRPYRSEFAIAYRYEVDTVGEAAITFGLRQTISPRAVYLASLTRRLP